MLRELDLSYGSICQSAIEELLACCTHLTHVNLNGCVNMHDLDWASPRGSPSAMIQCESSLEPTDKQPERLLEILNCVGCPNIRKVLIPPPAQCFHLTSLNVSLSVNLKEVDISCLNLCFLNLRYIMTLVCIIHLTGERFIISIGSKPKLLPNKIKQWDYGSKYPQTGYFYFSC